MTAASGAAASPLVVVSNRLPFEVKRTPAGVRISRSPGGLVAALEPVLEARGGVWIGWPGLEQDEDAPLPLPEAAPSVRYYAVPLTAREVSGYYGGFANRTIWPLFHYFVARTHMDTATWRTYDRINARFAEAAAGASDEGAPGPRADYGEAYYGCFVRDLDGHKIEAAYWDMG